MAFLAQENQEVLLKRLRRHCRRSGESPNALRKRAGFTCSSFYKVWRGVGRVRETTAKKLCSAVGWEKFLSLSNGRPKDSSLLEAAAACYTFWLSRGMKASLVSGGDFPDTAVVLLTQPERSSRFVLEKTDRKYIQVSISHTSVGEMWLDDYTGPFSMGLMRKVEDWLTPSTDGTLPSLDLRFHDRLKTTYKRTIKCMSPA